MVRFAPSHPAMLGTLADGWPIDEAINNPRDDESWWITELL